MGWQVSCSRCPCPALMEKEERFLLTRGELSGPWTSCYPGRRSLVVCGGLWCLWWSLVVPGCPWFGTILWFFCMLCEDPDDEGRGALLQLRIASIKFCSREL